MASEVILALGWAVKKIAERHATISLLIDRVAQLFEKAPTLTAEQVRDEISKMFAEVEQDERSEFAAYRRARDRAEQKTADEG